MIQPWLVAFFGIFIDSDYRFQTEQVIWIGFSI